MGAKSAGGIHGAVAVFRLAKQAVTGILRSHLVPKGRAPDRPGVFRALLREKCTLAARFP